MHAHDPTLLAWVITGGYFVAAVLTVVAGSSSDDRRERWFWWACATLMVLLGFNKQLDLQGYITSAGRALAHQEGWFAQRRTVQAAFIVALLIVSLAVLAALAVWLRRSASTVKIAALGLVLLFAFVLWRAASFHHMDVWSTREVAGMRTGWWLELAGIIVLSISAIAFRRNRAALAPL